MMKIDSICGISPILEVFIVLKWCHVMLCHACISLRGYRCLTWHAFPAVPQTSSSGRTKPEHVQFGIVVLAYVHFNTDYMIPEDHYMHLSLAWNRVSTSALVLTYKRFSVSMSWMCCCATSLNNNGHHAAWWGL
jgi:hypothetical protein